MLDIYSSKRFKKVRNGIGMNAGVNIDQGPVNWQIIQHTDAKADIELSGTFALPEGFEEGKVYARVVREDMGISVIGWTACETLENDRWKVKLQDVPAGGLYRIETCLSHAKLGEAIEWAFRGDMIHHIGVGDIYVIAGQSNSAGYGKDPVYDPPEIGIHILRNSGKWDLASHPLNDSTHTVHPENRDRANPGHSPYLAFSRLLKKELGYPIGLIQTALCGSGLESWNPGEDGILYRNMLSIVRSQGGKLKGILWYQGCSDTREPLCDTYLERFRNMVSCLRVDLEEESLPFLTVQINRKTTPSDPASDQCWAKVREAQRAAARGIPHVYIVPSLDCTLTDEIHNSSASNMVLGERIAKTALAQIYKRNFHCSPPDIISAQISNTQTLKLVFGGIKGRMFAYHVGAKQIPFTVEDTLGQLEIDSYTIENRNEIHLKLNRDIEGKVFVHGAYGQNPIQPVPIDTETHLPMLAFYGVEAVRENI